MTEANHFLVNHGQWILFLAVFAEQMGLPLPAVPWLLAAGALSATGQFNAPVGIGSSVLACLLGDMFWFYLGRYRGTKVLGLLCRISLEPDSCVRRTSNLFTRYGLRGLLVAKFVPGLSTVAPPLAGMAGVNISTFLMVDAAGSLLYGAGFIILGRCFSGQIEQIGTALGHIGTTALVFFGALVVIYISFKYWRRQQLIKNYNATRITVAELNQKLDAGETPVILDLRSATELELDATIILGAIHVDINNIENHSHKIPDNQDIILYCSCPNEYTSARIAQLLRQKGFKRVRPLQGGIAAWRESKFPTSKHIPETSKMPEFNPTKMTAG